MPTSHNILIDAFRAEFTRYRKLAEGAAAQITWDELRKPFDPQTNSATVIMKHVAGNLRSRWTDPLTTDGEKPTRDRDNEFIDSYPDRAALEADWAEGWAILDRALGSFTDADLNRELRIRNEPMTLAAALARSLSHIAYHAGQVVQLCRAAASAANRPWNTLTVPRGGSAAYNKNLGFTPSAEPHAPPAKNP